ncbi:conserved membrane protein of unknown function [Candidatus Hydrogenisulfobacillus filiaventi]|uniref:Uncharacterized protein n=1 Tax=Candidatus Hydrogenisulfobacillus filiaventi TaxID=2707344 RepID=A0A6F8ZEU2_9FIRM|nr:hypothetical protein [Bacillota bacterium]CAB1128516.1 conserved membrane protein of unknown function [Candidatus Hydrogenisulfobacillus filiaventi]
MPVLHGGRVDASERAALIQHLTPPPGITMAPYPAWRDVAYRISLVLFLLGLVGMAVVDAARLNTAAVWMQGLVALAATGAGWFFLVWLSGWRWLVRSLATLGAAGWLGGLAGGVPALLVVGWAGTLAATSIMAAKEDHCFRLPTGKVVPWASLLLGIGILAGFPLRADAVLWAMIAALWAALLIRRFRLPLFEID